MKIAIRDDDLNYFYTPALIDHWLSEIFQISPVSMSVIPFVKGNWFEITSLLEKAGSNNVNTFIIESILKDKMIYPIHKNDLLTSYIKEKIVEGKIYLTLHGITHRNDSDAYNILADNFPIGAEFFTDKDLTSDVKEAINYIETIFEQKITIFTPPQNKISYIGAKSLINNNINICCHPLPIANIYDNFMLVGLLNYSRIILHRLQTNSYRSYPYPNTLKSNNILFRDHRPIQPGMSLNTILNDLKRAYDDGKDIILSTHSYAFDEEMNEQNFTMGTGILWLLNEISKLPNVAFVPINEILI